MSEFIVFTVMAGWAANCLVFGVWAYFDSRKNGDAMEKAVALAVMIPYSVIVLPFCIWRNLRGGK